MSSTLSSVKSILAAQLGQAVNIDTLTTESRLAGAIPDFDSLVELGLVLGIEAAFCVEVPDETLTRETFATVGSLTHYVDDLLGQRGAAS